MKYHDNERAFTQWVLTEARKQGWMAWHFGNTTKLVTRRGGGLKAIPDKDGAGFPDLVLAHPVHGLVFIELKMGLEQPRPNQLQALRALRATGARVYVFHPHEQDALEDVLAGIRQLAGAV